MARILSFDRARDRFVHLELIIVRQFFARADGSGRENAPTVNSRLTHLNERHGEEARCASVNGYLLSIIESKELASRTASLSDGGHGELVLRRSRELATASSSAGEQGAG